MKKNLSLGIAMLMLTGCFEKEHENPLSALSVEHNSIQMTIGDSWLYKHMFINVGIDSSLHLPDTLVGYSYFKALKDTVIDSKSYLIIEGRDYEVDRDSVSVFKKRSAIHLSDTISMFEFQTGDFGFMSGVLKAAMPQYRLTNSNYGTTIMKKINLHKLSLVFSYDPKIYSDFVYPLIFPLIKDSIYIYRDTADPNGNGPYRRKFISIEKVIIPLGQFEAYKLEWLVKEAIGIDSIFAYDWIGDRGLLKRFWDCGKNTIDDSLGIPLDTCQTYDILEKIGITDINPDTIIPWGRRKD
jgi:hypothetical protein